MNYRVELKRSAEKELAELSGETQRRIARALLELARTPLPPGVKKLRGGKGYRIRIGDFRIVYSFDPSASLVVVSAIAHRRDVYR